MRRGKAQPKGYENQSAPAAEPRREHVQQPAFSSLEETLFYRDAVADRQPGEDVIAWLDRTRDRAVRATLGPGADDDSV